MVEIVQQAANFLHLAPGWEEQIIFAAGDGDYSYFVVKDEDTIQYTLFIEVFYNISVSSVNYSAIELPEHRGV